MTPITKGTSEQVVHERGTVDSVINLHCVVIHLNATARQITFLGCDIVCCLSRSRQLLKLILKVYPPAFREGLDLNRATQQFNVVPVAYI